jgi:hypothetical protein
MCVVKGPGRYGGRALSRDHAGIGSILRGVARELPVINDRPRCPAALPIAGATRAMAGVVCRAMEQDIERDDGTDLAMNAGQYGYLQHEAVAGVHMNLKSDPKTVVGLCHGDGLPVLTDDDHQARDHYSYCPVWQAEKDRIREGRDELAPEQQPEPTSMGVSSLDAPDPWAAARAGLEELAPAVRP